MKLTFLGGAHSVTGANYLLEHKNQKILIDCGLFQGSEFADELNYTPFGYKPSEVQHVLITHSHIDHVGRLPKLFRDGFRGSVITTGASVDMIRVTLPDNMRHIEEEARDMGREPLFHESDMNGLFGLLWETQYHKDIDLGDGISAKFLDAGHILGSAIIVISWKDADGTAKKIAFTGDLGNPPTPLLRPTEYVSDVDYVVIESAYGDRIHENRDQRRELLRGVVMETMQGNGALLIPSFAVERTQELLYELDQISHEHSFENVPVFVDSPLAIKMTSVYQKHGDYFNKEAAYLINSGDDIFHFKGLHMTASVEESKAINAAPFPKIIIAGSGMSQGGRILHHEQRYLPDPRSTILFIGHQVAGSRGRKIQQGDDVVRIFGENVPIRCRRITISSYSAHADQNGLLAWIERARNPLTGKKTRLKHVFVVQGEESAAKELARLAAERFGLTTDAPAQGESVML